MLLIHDNFRKLLRRIIGVGYSSSSETNIRDFTDITGYTGTENDNPSSVNSYHILNTNITNKSYSDFTNSSSTSYNSLVYGGIGRSVENEPDYNLGSMITDDIKVSTAHTRSNATALVSVITNAGSSDVEFNEVALFIHYKTSSGTPWNGGTNMIFMLAKKILDNPITLPSGASITITCSLFADEAVDIAVEES